MGICSSSSPSPAEKAAKQQTAAIEKQLKNANKIESDKVKLLLLGAGESGKSTIFKQFRVLYGAPRSEEDLQFYASAVRNNITVLVKKLLPLVATLGLEGQLEPHERAAYETLTADISSEGAAPPLLPVARQKELRTLFRSHAWASVWAHRSTVNAIDAHRLYVDELDAIAAPGYVPTVQHIVNARIRTTSPTKEEFDIHGRRCEIYDVGGQRSERKKWFPLFDDVTAVIFVAALSGYDQMLQEDRRMNRLVEAVALFRTIITHASFEKVPIMLFLNKKDLFEEKLPLSRIQEQKEFADYAGNSYEQATTYFEQKFQDCFATEADAEKRLHMHTTNATDTTNVKFVWGSCAKIILQQNFAEWH